MSLSPNRKRATNGTDDVDAPHFRSVSQLAYANYGIAKASPTRFTHPKDASAIKSPAPFFGKSNADLSYTNTITPPIVHVSPTRSNANASHAQQRHVSPSPSSGTSAASPSSALVHNSESRSHFRNHGDCRRETHRPKGQTIQPVPFRGESESRREYVEHKISSVPQIKHEAERTLPRLPFKGTSTMRESYTGSPVRSRLE